MTSVSDYLKENYYNHLEELKEFISFQSISTQSKHKNDIGNCSKYVMDLLFKAGLKTEKIETNGNPIIYGEWNGSDILQTLLIYGHYDVQPADSSDLWETSPFEPSFRQGYLFGRGASDNKSQIFLHIKVIEAFLQVHKKLPFNVKFCIEGEEEVGSESLFSIIEEFPDKLRSDIVLISDTSMLGENVPSICTGLRGLLGFEIEVQGPQFDLPSGSFYGGAVQNPIHAIAEIISRLRDNNNKIKVPHFYEDVYSLSEEERLQLVNLPFDDEWLLNQTKVPSLYGESGFSSLERAWIRPTIEVNGIHGGYTSEGGMTVIPSKVIAKLTCRLVPNQNPNKIMEYVEKYIHSMEIDGVNVKVKQTSESSFPYSISQSEESLRFAVEALEDAFDTECHLIKAGGSIPIVAELYKRYNCPIILMGFGLPNGNVHGPNEHFSMDHYNKGLYALSNFYNKFC